MACLNRSCCSVTGLTCARVTETCYHGSQKLPWPSQVCLGTEEHFKVKCQRPGRGENSDGETLMQSFKYTFTWEPKPGKEALQDSKLFWFCNNWHLELGIIYCIYIYTHTRYIYIYIHCIYIYIYMHICINIYIYMYMIGEEWGHGYGSGDLVSLGNCGRTRVQQDIPISDWAG